MAMRGGSFDYDEYTEEPGGGRAHSRYVNTETIQVSDSDDDREIPQSHTEETLVSTGPVDESGTTSGEAQARESHSSSDEENDPSKSLGKMAKLFGKSKKKDGKDKSKEKKDKKEKENKKEKQTEKKEKKKEKEEAKAKKEREAKEKKEREVREKKEKEAREKEAKEKKEKKKKATKGVKENEDESDKDDTDEPKEKKKPRDKSPRRMPGFAKLGLLKRNKKDSNTSNDSDITPPKQTSTPPSHRFDLHPRDTSSEAPHDQTFAQSEHNGATSAAANSDVFDESEKVPLEEMDPRVKYGGPPPETIPVPMPMPDEPLGYVPPPMVPVTETHVPPQPEDTTAPKTVPYSYTKGKQSISDRIRAPLNNILMNKRSPKFQQGDGIAGLKPQSQPPITRCSTFLLAVLVSGFILGIILTAVSSLSDTLAVIGPCFIGLSFFGLIGKIFFTLWWEEDPLPPLNKFNNQFIGFMEGGPNYKKDPVEAYPMYPVHSSRPVLPEYNEYNMQSEVTEMTPMKNEMMLAPDDVPDIGLRFTDSDMEYPLRDSSEPSHEDSIDAYKRMRRDSISSDENVHAIKPSFV